ncbi:MAG: molybdenum cofactor guanylyltransferase [Methanomicrobiales archaeon]|nr:molybdenum cofactor guanylyltransferase [Methanomicrobiales archaeon]
MVQRTAIILVGGEARRAGGREKYFFSYRGETFIDRLVTALSKVADEIIVVARDPEQCARFLHIGGVAIVPDIRTGIGPIGGIHAGVLQARGDLVFIAACDMPCINPAVVELLFSLIDTCDAAIPAWDENRLEPLHAVYRRTALLAYLRDHTSLSLRDMVRSIRARYIPVGLLRPMDPDLSTFTNINDLETLRRINHGHTEE